MAEPTNTDLVRMLVSVPRGSDTIRPRSKRRRGKKGGPMSCPVCGKPADLFAIADGGPCMRCVRARARSAMDHRCHCGNQRIPGGVRSVGSRSWVPCDRCLGTIGQLS